MQIWAGSETSSRLTDTNQDSHSPSSANEPSLSPNTNALDFIKRPVIALDSLGRVIGFNTYVPPLFDDDFRISHRRLCVRDKLAKSDISHLIGQLHLTSDIAPIPIVIRRKERRPIVMRCLPLQEAAQMLFFGARIFIVITDLDSKTVPHEAVIQKVFGLTEAQARLAALLANGHSLVGAAIEIGIATETARKYLKAIFQRMSVRRQGEMIALLSRIPGL